MVCLFVKKYLERQVLGGGMYETFYGLREKPFNLTPDPRFLYLSEMHKEAFAHLIFGIRNRVGFIMVTGEIGTGKTTICRSLLGQLDQDVELAFIFNPCLSPEELLRKINEDFGIRSRAISVKGLIDELNTYLLDRHSKSKNSVLMIDEAQNLTTPVLEQIRLLSNLETERQKLLQIVLIGQPELAEHLELPELRQLNQRITARYHLKPLGEKETMQYIAYRLRIAGGMRKVHFTRNAIKSIFRYSKGTPRVINAICDRALLIGYAKETRDISRGIIKQAAREIRGERVRAKKKWGFLSRYAPTPRLVAAAALIVLVGLFIMYPLADRLDVLVAFLNRPPSPSPTAEPLAVHTSSEAPELPPAKTDAAKNDEVAAEIPEPAPEQSDESPKAAGEREDSDVSDASEGSEESEGSEGSEESEKVTAEPEPAVPASEETAVPEKLGAKAGPEPPTPIPAKAPPKKQSGVFDAIALVASVVPKEEPSIEASDEPEAPEQEMTTSESAAEPEAEQVAELEEPVPSETSTEDTASEPADEEDRTVEVAKVDKTAPEQPVTPQKPVQVQNFAEVLQELDPADALKTAATSLLRAWNMALLSDVPAGQRVTHLAEFASAYGFATESLSPSVIELEALNLPAFVRVGVGEKLLWLAVVGMDEKHVRCSTGNGTVAIVPRDEFAKVYLAEAVVPWRDPAPGAEILKPNMEGDHVRALQYRLRQLGFYEGELTGVYDAATAQAVTRIQSETALKKDAKAGQQVRMVLCSWLDDFPTPGLQKKDMSSPAQTVSKSETPDSPRDQKKPSAASVQTPLGPAPIAHAEETAEASGVETQTDANSDTPSETIAAPKPSPETGPKEENIADVSAPAAPDQTPEEITQDMTVSTDSEATADGPDAPPPLVTIVELPEGVGPPPSPPSQDVEALLMEEVYGEARQQNSRKEVTAPLYTGVPLVPHRTDKAEAASRENR
ncbi:MAG: AAA family ATPase [Candidatus Hydrogenedentes bacterium]|nr:AAA family ATPase [Candidatus Hydrogenedentota bacterium]